MVTYFKCIVLIHAIQVWTILLTSSFITMEYLFLDMAKKLNRLIDVLKEKEITAYRLAKDSGVAYDLVRAYTRNDRQPSMETLFKLAKALKISPKELIND